MTYYILAESATVIEKIYDLQPSMMPSKHPYSSGAPWQQKQLSSSACWYLSSIASSAKSLASFPWMVTYSQTSSSSFSWILLAKMLWQNQTVGALNIWKPIEACLWHFCPFFNKLTMQCYQPGKSHPLLFGNYFCHSNHWCCNLQPQWSSAKLNQKICSQLKLFASGHIKTLYSEMKLYILKWWVNYPPMYNVQLPWIILMSVNLLSTAWCRQFSKI